MRLIDADALYEKHRKRLGCKSFMISHADIFDAPTIDPVRHGHWHHVKEHAYMGGDEAKEWDNFYCSECDAPSSGPYNYCPYCGSKNM